MGLPKLIGTSARGLGGYSTGQNTTKRNYTALFLINKGQLPAIGAAYTNDADGGIGTIAAVTPSNLAAICRDLVLFNKGRMFPMGSTQGSKGRTVNITKGQVYGDDTAEAPTGEITEMFTFVLDNYYQNIDGMNAIRENSKEYDAVLFTTSTAEIYTQAEHNVQVLNVGDEADGSNSVVRNGGFDIGIRSASGQVVPVEGIKKSDLADTLKFTITDGTLVNCTKGTCSGKYVKFTRTTSATLSSIAFAKDAAVTCVTWSIFKLVNGELVTPTGANDATISQAGLVSFPSGHTAGATKYVACVQNETGIYGKYFLEINI